MATDTKPGIVWEKTSPATSDPLFIFWAKKVFVADFYCPNKKLVIELDGKIHECQKEYDELRTYIIQQLGYRVIRVANHEILDIERLKEKLRPFLE